MSIGPPLMYWKMRLELLWKFIKLVPEARTLELEVQDAFQRLNNMRFANDLSHGRYEIELAKTEGYAQGIEWCLKRFS